MNVIDEIIKELQKEELIDDFKAESFFNNRNSNISNIYKAEMQFNSRENEPTILTKNIAESLSKQSELRYSISAISTNQTQFLPQPRLRLVKRNAKFSRTCKCCQANVFVLDAFCPHCNERLIGNFFYYSFFLVSAAMIGFMVFYMATSNPY